MNSHSAKKELTWWESLIMVSAGNKAFCQSSNSEKQFTTSSIWGLSTVAQVGVFFFFHFGNKNCLETAPFKNQTAASILAIYGQIIYSKQHLLTLTREFIPHSSCYLLWENSSKTILSSHYIRIHSKKSDLLLSEKSFQIKLT